jgi:hypothetical protein
MCFKCVTVSAHIKESDCGYFPKMKALYTYKTKYSNVENKWLLLAKIEYLKSAEILSENEPEPKIPRKNQRMDFYINLSNLKDYTLLVYEEYDKVKKIEIDANQNYWEQVFHEGDDAIEQKDEEKVESVKISDIKVIEEDPRQIEIESDRNGTEIILIESDDESKVEYTTVIEKYKTKNSCLYNLTINKFPTKGNSLFHSLIDQLTLKNLICEEVTCSNLRNYCADSIEENILESKEYEEIVINYLKTVEDFKSFDDSYEMIDSYLQKLQEPTFPGDYFCLALISLNKKIVINIFYVISAENMTVFKIDPPGKSQIIHEIDLIYYENDNSFHSVKYRIFSEPFDMEMEKFGSIEEGGKIEPLSVMIENEKDQNYKVFSCLENKSIFTYEVLKISENNLFSAIASQYHNLNPYIDKKELLKYKKFYENVCSKSGDSNLEATMATFLCSKINVYYSNKDYEITGISSFREFEGPFRNEINLMKYEDNGVILYDSIHSISIKALIDKVTFNLRDIQKITYKECQGTEDEINIINELRSLNLNCKFEDPPKYLKYLAKKYKTSIRIFYFHSEEKQFKRIEFDYPNSDNKTLNLLSDSLNWYKFIKEVTHEVEINAHTFENVEIPSTGSSLFLSICLKLREFGIYETNLSLRNKTVDLIMNKIDDYYKNGQHEFYHKTFQNQLNLILNETTPEFAKANVVDIINLYFENLRSNKDHYGDALCFPAISEIFNIKIIIFNHYLISPCNSSNVVHKEVYDPPNSEESKDMKTILLYSKGGSFHYDLIVDIKMPEIDEILLKINKAKMELPKDEYEKYTVKVNHLKYIKHDLDYKVFKQMLSDILVEIQNYGPNTEIGTIRTLKENEDPLNRQKILNLKIMKYNEISEKIQKLQEEMESYSEEISDTKLDNSKQEEIDDILQHPERMENISDAHLAKLSIDKAENSIKISDDTTEEIELEFDNPAAYKIDCNISELPTELAENPTTQKSPNENKESARDIPSMAKVVCLDTAINELSVDKEIAGKTLEVDVKTAETIDGSRIPENIIIYNIVKIGCELDILSKNPDIGCKMSDVSSESSSVKNTLETSNEVAESIEATSGVVGTENGFSMSNKLEILLNVKLEAPNLTPKKMENTLETLPGPIEICGNVETIYSALANQRKDSNPEFQNMTSSEKSDEILNVSLNPGEIEVFFNLRLRN